MKRKIKIVIDRSKDLYGAYAENANGVWGSGETILETKKSLEKTIELLKKYNKPENIPAILKGDYELVYKFDVPSLLKHYKGLFTNAALERITGLPKNELKQYSTGLKKPRLSQTRRIQKALHSLGNDLISVEL